jgi:hypothetical protein
LARKENKMQYVLTDMQDIIGFCGHLPRKWRNAYSAALHLAGRLSQGGLELYAFELTHDQCMVVALNESRPIPGFDFVGEAALGRGLVEEFLAIEQGQPIRFVGNAGWLEGEENVALEDIFANPASAARLKRLWAANSVKWAAGGAALLLSLVAGGHYWVEMEREEMMLAAQNPAIDPNAEYQQSLAQAWTEVASPGPGLLVQWQALMADLPLVHQGWGLKKVECSSRKCSHMQPVPKLKHRKHSGASHSRHIQYGRRESHIAHEPRTLGVRVRHSHIVPFCVLHRSQRTKSQSRQHQCVSSSPHREQSVPIGLSVIMMLRSV